MTLDKTEKFLIAGFTLSLIGMIGSIFGVEALAVIGIALVIGAVIAAIAWVNYATGGTLGFLMMMFSL